VLPEIGDEQVTVMAVGGGDEEDDQAARIEEAKATAEAALDELRAQASIAGASLLLVHCHTHLLKPPQMPLHNRRVRVSVRARVRAKVRARAPVRAKVRVRVGVRAKVRVRVGVRVRVRTTDVAPCS